MRHDAQRLNASSSIQPDGALAPTSATGIGWERTPWHAVQRAAWEALKEYGLIKPPPS